MAAHDSALSACSFLQINHSSTHISSSNVQQNQKTGQSKRFYLLTLSLCIILPVFLTKHRPRPGGCKQPNKQPRSGSSPSSSPMRSSFQVQQSSINLIQSPTPSSGREPSRLWSTDNRCRTTPSSSCSTGGSSRCVSVAPCGSPLAESSARFSGASFNTAADQ